MSSLEAFGPNLRRRRLQRGISLEELSKRTNVSIELWEGMERNDFSRWPTGVAARAFIRDYAVTIGEDPVDTIAEFCRVVPNGDRRAEPLLRKTAEFLRHDLTWEDDLAGARREQDRRAPASRAAEPAAERRNLRALAAAVDFLVVTAGGCGAALALRLPIGSSVAVVALVYHAVSMPILGSSPSAAIIELYLSTRRRTHMRAARSVFPRLSALSAEDPQPNHRAK